MPITFTTNEQSISLEAVASLIESVLYSPPPWWDLQERVEPSSWEYKSEPKREGDDTCYSCDYPLNPGGALIFVDREEGDNKPLTLNAESIQRGLNLLTEEYPHYIRDILEENADLLTGDALLQCALFRDIIYA